MLASSIKLIEGSLNSTRTYTNIFWITFFAFLTFVGAQIEIPVVPVPVTLQTFAVLLSAVFLGKNRAPISQVVYIGLGCAGLPVFAGFSAGFLKLIGPTGGYLAGFIAASFVTPYLIQYAKGFWSMFVSVLAGSLVIFGFGVIQLNLTLIHNWDAALEKGFVLFALWDIVKVFAVSAIYYEYYKQINRG